MVKIKRIWHASGYGLPGSTCTFHCGACGYELMPEWRFCPHCGSELEGNFLPEQLKGKDIVTLLQIVNPPSFLTDADSEYKAESKMYRMTAPEFLIYHDLIELIHTNLEQISDALKTIGKTGEYPKNALNILNLVEIAIRDFENTWEDVDFVFKKGN